MWVTRNTYDVMRSPCTTLSYSAPSATVHAGIQAAGVSCRRSVRLSTYLIVASLHSFLPPHTCMLPPSLTHPLAFLSVASPHSLFLLSARGPRTCMLPPSLTHPPALLSCVVRVDCSLALCGAVGAAAVLRVSRGHRPLHLHHPILRVSGRLAG